MCNEELYKVESKQIIVISIMDIYKFLFFLLILILITSKNYNLICKYHGNVECNFVI